MSTKIFNFTRIIVICWFTIAWTINVFATVKKQSICINEIMQSNINTVFTEMDFPDSWVELYNPTEEDISIYHFYIGSSPNYKENFRIQEDEIIRVGGYTLIYMDKEAKGKHTDFRLNSDVSGVLFLFNAQGVLLDSLTYPAMTAPNIAYARNTDGAEIWHFVRNSTPNSPNVGEEEKVYLPPFLSIIEKVSNDPNYKNRTIAKKDRQYVKK